MKNKLHVRAICFLLSIYALILSTGITVGAEQLYDIGDDAVPTLSEDVEVGSRLLDLFFGKKDKKEEPEQIMLYPGGGVFGVKIKQDKVTVTESSGIPALKSGDVILSINGEKVSSARDVKRLVQKSGGKSITIRAIHNGQEIAVEIIPTFDGEEYKIGVTLRDGAAGLGTVTFVDPKTGLFGGLGHGICDSDSGEIISMESGEVLEVILGGVNKGEAGKPGELRGILTDEDIGDLTLNCECGVFGVLSDTTAFSKDALPIGSKGEVHEGEAKIISTIKNGKSAEYKIEIFDIDRDSTGSKSFRIRVTDETLKALTGGIVRGMSGSPIIQDGKIVGAVTHVLVADPTEGYGIFIENMMHASQTARNELPAA